MHELGWVEVTHACAHAHMDPRADTHKHTQVSQSQGDFSGDDIQSMEWDPVKSPVRVLNFDNGVTLKLVRLKGRDRMVI